MNGMERLLANDAARLIDRLAASMPEGSLEGIRGTTPLLSRRLDQMDETLAAAHASLLEGYTRWTQALDDLENIWALAAWRASAEDPIDEPPRLAA